MVSQKLLVVINLTMLSAHRAIPFFGNDSLKPSKLKRHKELQHTESMDSVETFQSEKSLLWYGVNAPCVRLSLISQPLLRLHMKIL